MSNRFTSPHEIENAVPAGPRNGAKTQKKAAKLSPRTYEKPHTIASADHAMRQVDIPDASTFSLKLVDGTSLPFRSDPSGLIEAFDFLTHDGEVVRHERRLVTIVPGMSELSGRKPYLRGDSVEDRRRDKALMVALWNGLTPKEQDAFLAKYAGNGRAVA